MKTLLGGILIGFANLIPGVSGGTIAVVLGVYEKIINAIVSLMKLKISKDQVIFLIQLAAGIGVALLAGSKLMSYLLSFYPAVAYSAFCGLVLGTLPDFYKQIPKLRTIYVLIGVTVLLIVEFSKTATLNLGKPALFIGGILAAIAMVLPGLSGSLVMLIFGIYENVLTALTTLQLSVLIPFGTGVILGIAIAITGMRYLLKNFRNQTYNLILGLLLASIIKIQPFDKQQMTVSVVILSLLTIGVTGFLSFSMSKK